MNVRQMEIVCDEDKLPVDIQETCMKYKTIKQWAYILHDKDDTRPHYHIYLNFSPSSCDSKIVAGWFSIPENFIERVKGRKADMLLYLTHGNDSQKNKHQYSPSEVHANFDFETEIKASKIIGDFENHTYAEMLLYIDTLPVSEKATLFSRTKKLWEFECTKRGMDTDRHIEVLFITGKGGTGKTYYAKKLLKEVYKYDYCISSSSNDPWQDYLGQRAIILDDLRDKSFELEDLLKILDNDTSSSIKSRFSNKVFTGKMIIITSAVPLVYWYPEYKCSKFDTLNQLYRRITGYVEVRADTVTVYNELDDNGKPKGLGKVFKNELAEKKKERPPKTDFGAVFGKLCENYDFPSEGTPAAKPKAAAVQRTFLTVDENVPDVF